MSPVPWWITAERKEEPVTFQTPNPEAQPIGDDHLFEVTLTIPDIGGSSAYEAAQVFQRIIADKITLFYNVRDEDTGEHFYIEVEAPE
jgi:hypothetical protein